MKDVKELIEHGARNKNKLHMLLPTDILSHIKKELIITEEIIE